jgi:beta-N-acetylglucosaminidase
MAMLIGLFFAPAPASLAGSTSVKKSFIAGVVSAAQAAQREYGVPAAVSIAQAAVNTGYGTSALATKAKNLFGIRCTARLSAAQFAKLAEAQVGKKYVLGAEVALSTNNPKAFDCSELVQWLFGRSGSPITDLAAAQYSATSKVTGPPKAGDLVFLRNNPARANGIGHVAVVTKKRSNGDWEVIEARGHADGVVKTTLSYWKHRSYYAGLRRYSKLNFVGASGVTSASAASSYQAGCLSVTSGGKTIKYSKFSTKGDSILGHAAIVAKGSEYSPARKAMNNDSAFVEAIAKVEHSSSAAAYAKALKSAISTYNLTQYDVAPLSIVLLSGASGAKVSAVQQLLNAKGARVKNTGNYDSATVNAVKKLQAAKKLKVDGQAGPSTLTALMSKVKQGSSGSPVSALKVLLGLAGYNTESGAGFGSTTMASLRAFQSRNGITATGATDVKTWSKLFMLIETAPTPKLSGTTTVGKRLTATAGTWGPGNVEVSYQWYRNNSAIPSARASTYVLQPADAGQTIRVRATGAKAPYTPVARNSTGTAAITKAKLTSRSNPKISGTRKVGRTLTAKAGAWSEKPQLSYQWYRGGKALKPATKSTYKLTSHDRHKTITVRVSASKPGYFTTSTKVSTKVA